MDPQDINVTRNKRTEYFSYLLEDAKRNRTEAPNLATAGTGGLPSVVGARVAGGGASSVVRAANREEGDDVIIASLMKAMADTQKPSGVEASSAFPRPRNLAPPEGAHILCFGATNPESGYSRLALFEAEMRKQNRDVAFMAVEAKKVEFAPTKEKWEDA